MFKESFIKNDECGDNEKPAAIYFFVGIKRIKGIWWNGSYSNRNTVLGQKHSNLDLKKLTHISCSIAALYTEACSIQILISAHIGSIDTSSIISFKLNHMI